MLVLLMQFLAVFVGGIVGTLLGNKMNKNFADELNKVLGVCGLAMGIFAIGNIIHLPVVILSIVAGSAIGLWLHVSRGITQAATKVQTLMSKYLPVKENFDEALYVTAVVLFCSSATGIVGSLELGMTGNGAMLLSKCILDFVTSMIFASTLGFMTSLIAIPQFIVFFILFSAAKLIMPLTTPDMISNLKACGGIILVCLGLRICKIKDFPVAEMIISLILVMPLTWVWVNYIGPLF